jgi:hypothetical protein
MKTFFCNRTVDKSEMKRLIKWVLLNYGTQKATRFVDHLKTLGFYSATTAGISLGIDDLRIPPVKSVFLKNAEKDILDNDLRYTRGQITAVDRLEKALDIWNTTNDTLKNEVIAHFRETDIFNPVYMMAFSGARGNISQVRQLVGMRGLMADQQGQVLDFPIRRNFREGLTVTEYMISCYGARKGLVDTALRTANSGYLTRRLVDVAQSVIIQQFDCGTTEGLEVEPSSKHDFANIVGRVLLQAIVDEQTGKYLARKNTEISPLLATKLISLPKVVVRSPLTCRLNSVCQLCYGWDLSKQKLVQLGEAVGVLAAQSIGEPGTQLTMRTFHTGGVFAGEATEKVYAPYSGIISYSGIPRGRKVISRYGEPAFLTVVPVSIKITRSEHSKSVILRFPAFTLLFVYPGQYVMFHQSVAELSRVETENQHDDTATNITFGKKELLSPDTGQVYVDNVKISPLFPKRQSTTSSDLNKVGLFDKSMKKTHHRVFGYGFIWILSGQLLRNNQSYQGDYFHQGFQPFLAHNTYLKEHFDRSIDSRVEYHKNVSKLLTYQFVVRSGQNGPFDLVKHLIQKQYQIKTSIDVISHLKKPVAQSLVFTAKIAKPVTFISKMFEKFVSTDSLAKKHFLNQYLYSTVGLSLHCKINNNTPIHLRIQCKSLSSKLFSTRLNSCKATAIGKKCFRKRASHAYVQRTFSTKLNGRFCVPSINDSSLPLRDVMTPTICVTGYKHWSMISQMFPDSSLHTCYEPSNVFWNTIRTTFMESIKLKGAQSRSLFPKFAPILQRHTALTNANHYLNPVVYDAVTTVFKPSEMTKARNFIYNVEGEIRLPDLAITSLNQYAFECSGQQCLVQVGDYIRVGDAIFPGIQSPYSGQLIHINSVHIILRRVYPYAMSHGSSLFVNHGDLIQKNIAFGTLISEESTAGDIVQGLPKVDELLEAREPVEKILSSMHAQLAVLFLLYSKTYGLREGCRRSLQEIRCLLVNEVQAVYGSQGVFISDKHIEIIVRQMTTYVLIVDPGGTNLLPGDIVDLRRVDYFEGKPGTVQVQYRPILLGITRASLAAESFIAAASFQETKRVLTRAAVEGRIDWLTGLKENVILGRLIPAGTGLYI